ncbi:MAG: hypothetical protein AB4911_16880 [Oscillochloridaceae bacterium umkhey_bin13]
MPYSLVLRPRAPGLTRSQRVLVQVEGEAVVAVEYRPEGPLNEPFARMAHVEPNQLLELAAKQCPSCGLAHAVALSQAIEQLAAVQVPPRAAALRLVALELERASSHLRTAAAILEALDLPQLAATLTYHATATRTALAHLTHHAPERWLCVGGVAVSPGGWETSMVDQEIARQLEPLFALADRLISGRALLARTVEIGVMSAGTASQFGLAGPLARAVGLTTDLRLTAPYAAYASHPPELVTQEGGDVYARFVVLLLEAVEALKLADRVLHGLPAGPAQHQFDEPLPTGEAESSVEAPRGLLRYQIRTEYGKVSQVSVQPAPQLDRLLARVVLGQANLDDAALIILSCDPCDGCLPS